ncbi:MAG: DUF1772 domain-containing protein [Polyangiales bacterium]
MSALSTMGLWAVVIGCALMAGLYFAFSTFIMASLEAIPNSGGIAAMQSINRVILKSAFMPLFFGTSLASLALGVWGVVRWGDSGSHFLVSGGLVYVVGMLGVTAAFNVPLNDALDAVDASSRASLEVWSRYLRDWTRWNHVRTLSSLAASALFIAAARALS